jgi:hypothetical protein
LRKKEIPDVVKKTTRTGRGMGREDRCKVCLTLNDPDRYISRMWETVKRHYSGQHETAAETAARVVMKGLTAELAEILERIDAERQEQNNELQGDLFPEKDIANESEI